MPLVSLHAQKLNTIIGFRVRAVHDLVNDPLGQAQDVRGFAPWEGVTGLLQQGDFQGAQLVGHAADPGGEHDLFLILAIGTGTRLNRAMVLSGVNPPGNY